MYFRLSSCHFWFFFSKKWFFFRYVFFFLFVRFVQYVPVAVNNSIYLLVKIYIKNCVSGEASSKFQLRRLLGFGTKVVKLQATTVLTKTRFDRFAPFNWMNDCVFFSEYIADWHCWLNVPACSDANLKNGTSHDINYYYCCPSIHRANTRKKYKKKTKVIKAIQPTTNNQRIPKWMDLYFRFYCFVAVIFFFFFALISSLFSASRELFNVRFVVDSELAPWY